MSVETDPLKSLLADKDAIDTGRLAKVLTGKVAIDSATGSPILLEGFSALNAEKKILVLLLARVSAQLLGLVDDDHVAAKQIVDASGVPSGTIYPALKSLREGHRVTQNEKKWYAVPRARIPAAVKELSDGE